MGETDSAGQYSSSGVNNTDTVGTQKQNYSHLTTETTTIKMKQKKGLAVLPLEVRKEIARLGGIATYRVHPDHSHFSKDKEAASAAGRKGGVVQAERKARLQAEGIFVKYADQVIEAINRNDGTRRNFKLIARRDWQILTLLTNNYSNSEIAATLNTSIDSINVQVHYLKKKLGVSSRQEAVSLASDYNLISLLKKDKWSWPIPS